MNRECWLSQPMRMFPTLRKRAIYILLPIHFFIVLSYLETLLAPRDIWAQKCPGILAEVTKSPKLPIDIRLGIRGLLSWVTFHGEDSDDPAIGYSTFKTRHIPTVGITAGIFSVRDVFHWRGGLLLDASYVTKGSGITTLDGMEAGSLDLRYYDFTFLTQLEREIGAGFRGYMLGGPGLSLLRDATLVVPSGEYDNTDETTDKDVHFVVGMGIGWGFRPNHNITLDLRANIGTQTIDATVNNNDFKNLAISLSLGYQWSYPPRQRAASCPDP